MLVVPCIYYRQLTFTTAIVLRLSTYVAHYPARHPKAQLFAWSHQPPPPHRQPHLFRPLAFRHRIDQPLQDFSPSPVWRRQRRRQHPIHRPCDRAQFPVN